MFLILSIMITRIVLVGLLIAMKDFFNNTFEILEKFELLNSGKVLK